MDFLDVPLARILRAKAERAVAAGREEIVPGIPGIETIHLLRARDALSLKRLPKTMAVIGAGSTGCEIAALFASLGTRVLLVEREANVLPRVDREISAVAGARLARLGIEVATSAEILEAINATGAVYGLRVRSGATVETHALEAVVLAAGRTGKPVDPSLVRVAFVHTEVATAGLTAAEAKARFGGALVGRCDVSTLPRAVAEKVATGLVKIVAHPKTRKVVGCQIVADRAGEMIHEASVAIQLGTTVERLAAMPRADSAWSEGVGKAAAAVSNKRD